MIAPKVITSTTWTDIKTILERAMEPKKRFLIAERTNFMQMTQGKTETVGEFAARLREQAVRCEFDKLKETNDPAEELVKMQMIAGLSSYEIRKKILEKELSGSLHSDQIVELVQELEQVKSFVGQKVTDGMISNEATEDPKETIHASRYKAEENVESLFTKNAVINRKCTRCGGQWHKNRTQCPALNVNCNKCKLKGHFARMCRTNLSNDRVHHATGNHKDLDSEELIFHGEQLHPSSSQLCTAAVRCLMKINGSAVMMEKDSGASVSMISEKIWNNIGRPPLKNGKKKLLAYDRHEMTQMGVLESLVETDDEKYIPLSIPVIKCNQEFGLAGRDILPAESLDALHSEVSEDQNKYKRLKGIIGAKVEIRLKPGTAPIEQQARELPLALKIKVKQELDRMEDTGIIEKVSSSEWASPIVISIKPGRESPRICGDYVLVNKCILNQTYLTPTIETAFSKMANKNFFGKIDLSDAYYQLQLSDASKDVTTINTPFGRYRFTRLPYGIKISPAAFQREMENIIKEDPNIIIYQDDILVGAETKEGLKLKMNEVMKTLEKANVVVNQKKTILEASELKFLGHVVDKNGIRPDEGLVEKVRSINFPTTKKDLERFLGLAQFYGRLIPKFAELCLPLNKLKTQSEKFEATVEAKKAFEDIKMALSTYPCVKPFDVNSETVLRTDASESCISGIILQNNHPVMFISRQLTSAEKNYANIEREGLAIVWSMERAKKLLLGRKFKLQTDHEPLKYILNPLKCLSKTTSARLTRWAIRLAAFDYEIEFVPGRRLQDADALSRLDSCSTKEMENSYCVESIFESDFEVGILSRDEILEATTSCNLLKRIKNRIRSGRWGQVSQSERPFKSVREALSIEDDILEYGTITVVPQMLRRRVLESAHEVAHPSVKLTTAHIARELWWPGMIRDIDWYVTNCAVCSEVRPVKARTVDTWTKEEEPWTRVHMDHCEMKGGGLVLILSDAYSGWPEAIQVPNKSSMCVLKVLRAIFARNGVPKTLVSDNAPELKSEEIRRWLAIVGCKMVNSPPYFPASNGQAERLVRTLKNACAAWHPSIPFHSYLQKVLLTLRTARPSGGRENSPDIMMWGRRIRHPLTMTERVGDTLWLRDRNKDEFQKAEFVVQEGTNTALVRVEDTGHMRLAHRNQLSPRKDFEKVTGELSSSADNIGELEQSCNTRTMQSPDVVEKVVLHDYNLRPREKTINYKV